MKKAVWSAVAAAGLLAVASSASAQPPVNANINATVNVSARAVLDISGDVNFLDADPDLITTLTSNTITVGARARVAPTTSLTVTVVAASAFFDADSTIPVGAMQWTATGSAFTPHSGSFMSSGTPVTVAGWTGPANQSGTQTFTLPNSWSYAPGVHTVVLTYTLATP